MNIKLIQKHLKCRQARLESACKNKCSSQLTWKCTWKLSLQDLHFKSVSFFPSCQKRDECIQKLAPVLWLQLNNCRRKVPERTRLKIQQEKWRHHVCDWETAPPPTNKATNWLTGRVKMVMERSGVGALCSFLKCPTKETNREVKSRENSK